MKNDVRRAERIGARSPHYVRIDIYAASTDSPVTVKYAETLCTVYAKSREESEALATAINHAIEKTLKARAEMWADAA